MKEIPTILARAIKRYKGFSVNTALYSLAIILPMTIERLVVHPLLLRFIGKAAFGEFVIALSVIMPLSMIFTSGTRASFFRDHAHYQGAEKDRFFRSGLLANICILIIFVILIIVFSNPLGRLLSKDKVGTLTASYLRQLVLYGILAGIVTLLQMYIRAHLWYGRFLISSLIYAIAAGLIIVPVALGAREWVGLYYAIGVAGGTIGAGIILRNALWGRPIISKSDLKAYLKTVPLFTGAGVLTMVQPYIVRMYLGATVIPEKVTVFFAGSAMAMLFTQLPSMVGQVAITYIARHRNAQEMSPTTMKRYLLITFAMIVIIGILGAILGYVALFLLYPQVAKDSLPIFYICLIGAACVTPRPMLTGFVQKFLSPVVSTIVSGVSLAINIGLLILLIGPMGLMGAALALSAGNATIGIIYFILGCIIYVRVKRFAHLQGNKQEQPQ